MSCCQWHVRAPWICWAHDERADRVGSTHVEGQSGCSTRDVYLIVEPPATVQLSLCSASFFMSWTILSSLSLSERVETWLVRPANEYWLRLPREACFDQTVLLVVWKNVQDLINVVLKLKSKVQLVIVLGVHSSSMKDADHDASGWSFWTRSGSQEHTRRIARLWVRWVYWEMLPSSGSTQSKLDQLCYLRFCISALASRHWRSDTRENHDEGIVVAPIRMFWRIYLSTGSQTETSSLSLPNVSLALMFHISQISLAKRPAESTTLLSSATWSMTFTLARQCRVVGWHNHVLTDCLAHDERTYGPFSSLRPYEQRQVPTDCWVHDGGTYSLTLFTMTIHQGGLEASSQVEFHHRGSKKNSS